MTFNQFSICSQGLEPRVYHTAPCAFCPAICLQRIYRKWVPCEFHEGDYVLDSFDTFPEVTITKSEQTDATRKAQNVRGAKYDDVGAVDYLNYQRAMTNMAKRQLSTRKHIRTWSSFQHRENSELRLRSRERNILRVVQHPFVLSAVEDELGLVSNIRSTSCGDFSASRAPRQEGKPKQDRTSSRLRSGEAGNQVVLTGRVVYSYWMVSPYF